MKSVLEFDLSKPEDREQYEAAPNGFKYKRTIERFLTEMAGDLQHPRSGVMAKLAMDRLSQAAVASGVPEVRNLAHSLCVRQGLSDVANGS